jgi:hypothetical protein
LIVAVAAFVDTRRMRLLLSRGLVLTIAVAAAACSGSSSNASGDNNGANPDAGQSGAAVVPTGAIDGRVVLTGISPVAGLSVTAIGPTSRSTTTNADGTFAFSALADGTYALQVTAPSTKEGSVSKSVTIASGAPSHAGDITLTPLGVLKGKVTLGAGTATGNGGILVLAHGAVTTTDDSGAYALTTAVGATTVTAVKNGYDSATSASVTATYQTSTAVPDLLLKASAANSGGPSLGTVAAKVTLVGEATNAGATVSLGGTAFTATTAADGTFSIANVPTGAYLLHVVKAPLFDETLAQIIVLAGAKPLAIDGGGVFTLDTMEAQRGPRLASLSSQYASQSLLKAPSAAAFVYQEVAVSGPLGGSPQSTTSYLLNATTIRNLGTGPSFVTPLFAPNGSRVALSNGSEYDLTAGLTGAIVSFEASSTSVNSLLQASADSSTIAYMAATAANPSTHLHVSPMTGGGSKDFGAAQYNVQLSANGSTIAFFDNNQDVVRGTVATGATSIVKSNVAYVIFSADASTALVGDVGQSFSSVPMSGAAPTPIAGTYSPFFPWQGVPGFLACDNSTGKNMVFLTLDGNVHPIAASSCSANGGFGPLQSGADTLAAFSEMDGTWHVIDVTTFKDTVVVTPGTTVTSEILAAGGRFIVPTDKGLTSYKNDGTSPQVITASATDQILLSPDGSKVLYHQASDDTIRVAPTAGGASVVIVAAPTSGQAFTSAWSPGGTKVALSYIDASAAATILKIAPAAGGTPALIATHVSTIAFESDTSLLAALNNINPPFHFQDGLYRIPVP